MSQRPAPRGDPPPAGRDGVPRGVVQEIELELTRVRSEASAARWEARAAELELLLRRALDEPPLRDWATLVEALDRRRETVAPLPPTAAAPEALERSPPTADAGANSGQAESAGKPSTGKPSAGKPSAGKQPAGKPSAWKQPAGKSSAWKQPAGTPPAGRPPAATTTAIQGTAIQTKADVGVGGAGDSVGRAAGRAAVAGGRSASCIGGAGTIRQTPPDRRSPAASAIALQAARAPTPRRRGRPAAWLCSVGAHVALLLLLALMTLATHSPKDQIALSAAVRADTPQPLQTVAIRRAEQPPQPSDPVSDEPLAEVSPLADLAAVSAVPLDLAAAAPPPAGLAEALSSTAAAGDLLLQRPTEMTTEFFGVQGGGNHFCYIVDASQSMNGGRFESARAELLRSIDRLAAEQRFYVIFYSSSLERMRVARAAAPDEYSVMATPENKRAVRRWALGIGLQRGAPPDDALRFALQLRPDVIFLLSDGEFPQRIEALVGELNRSENLFGDAGPRTILHTIGYHSREGESRMRRLAEANAGRYRYVAPP